MRLKATPIFEASLRTRMVRPTFRMLQFPSTSLRQGLFNIFTSIDSMFVMFLRFSRKEKICLVCQLTAFVLCLSKPLVPWPRARRQYLYVSWSWQHISPQIDSINILNIWWNPLNSSRNSWTQSDETICHMFNRTLLSQSDWKQTSEWLLVRIRTCILSMDSVMCNCDIDTATWVSGVHLSSNRRRKQKIL